MIKFNKLFLLLSLILFTVSCTKDESSSEGGGINKSANYKSLGASANDLLSDENFTSINIEVVYVNGFAPSPEALEGLKSFLQQRAYKPDGINISQRAVSSSNKAPFDINEIADIERDIRTTFNAGDEISVYIYYADGSNEEDDEIVVLGSAYFNTSIVMYGKTINETAAQKDIQKSVIETAVLRHEFGHLFGLVNLGTPAQSDHIDPFVDSNGNVQEGGHCTVKDCLMQDQLEFGDGVVDFIDNGNIPVLDDQCITDLQANGGK
ncbi:hypothetical protein [Salegentibacter chungangensis]|uniref:Membrane metalloprotease n=1 Tax=Salegentibacter chungangensis TaxID=1335724 RepID=A0ABW3NS81_9FLAO